MSALDDDKIVALFYARKEEAIVELAKKYGGICTCVAKNILSDARDTEECVNDAYLGAWNTIPPQNPNPLLTYICRIVRNLAINRYHANSAVKRNSIYDISLEEVLDCFTLSFSPEDQMDAKETAQFINAFLGTLDKENRMIFVSRYWYSDSIEEIAKVFGISKHNVSVRLSRTREKLRKYLLKEGVYL